VFFCVTVTSPPDVVEVPELVDPELDERVELLDRDAVRVPLDEVRRGALAVERRTVVGAGASAAGVVSNADSESS
jgi:hypothetical protein